MTTPAHSRGQGTSALTVGQPLFSSLHWLRTRSPPALWPTPECWAVSADFARASQSGACMHTRKLPQQASCSFHRGTRRSGAAARRGATLRLPAVLCTLMYRDLWQQACCGREHWTQRGEGCEALSPQTQLLQACWKSPLQL